MTANSQPAKQTLLKALGNAFNGYFLFFKSDRNGKIHLAAACAVIIAGFVFNVSAVEWMVLCFCIGLVIALEMMNAAIENVCDLIQPTYHPVIKKVKDVSAASVLCAAFLSAVIGVIIFLPKVLMLL